MNKEILLDVDGVVIRPRHKYFSEKYSEEFGVPIDDILPFFKGEYKKAAIGEIDIKEVLPPYLTKWGWQGSVNKFLKYWYESETDIDKEVINEVRRIRDLGVKVYLVSDNEVGRANYLMEEVGLKNEFDRGFFSSNLGVTKSDPQFFEKVAKELQVKPEEIDYWDDDPKNIEVAKSVGVNGYVYLKVDFIESLSKIPAII